MRIAKISLALSFLLGWALAWAGPAADLQRALAGKTPAQVMQILRSMKSPYPELSGQISRILNTKSPDDIESLRKTLALAARSEISIEKGAGAQAREIKRSPLYRRASGPRESNWLATSISRMVDAIGAWLRKLFKRDPSPQQASSARGMDGSLIITYVMWVLLFAAAVFLFILALRRFQLKASRQRRALAMLEEDEPERTLDEWLTLADRLAAEGRHREAVRCLYLACLLKFDEHNVARFDRGQTNWEHLKRIEASSKNFEFREPTQRFDAIWYGGRTEGAADVQWFRGVYEGLSQRLAEAKAA